MCWLHFLHIVDSAARGTLSSVPQSKQVMLLFSGPVSFFFGLGWRASWTSKCRPHSLHTDVMAVAGTGCECPQCGQGTGTFSCLAGGITGPWKSVHKPLQESKDCRNCDGVVSSARFGQIGTGPGGTGRTFWILETARGRRRCSRDFVRVHFDASHESHAFFDRKLGRANVAEEFGLGFEFEFFAADDIAIYFAPNDNGLGFDITGDD